MWIYNNHISSSTTYYVSFEVESGDRMEFVVSGNEYGQLVGLYSTVEELVEELKNT